METEDFFIEVDSQRYKISSALHAPHNEDHEVWKDDELLFVLNHEFNESDEPCWTLKPEYKNKDIDLDLVSKISDKIESYYI